MLGMLQGALGCGSGEPQNGNGTTGSGGDGSGADGGGGDGSGGGGSSSSGSSGSSSGAMFSCTNQNVDGLWGTASAKGIAALKLDSASASFTLDIYAPLPGAQLSDAEVAGTFDVTALSQLVLDRSAGGCGPAAVFDYDCHTSGDFMWLATPGDPAVQWQKNPPYLPVQATLVPLCGP